MDRTVGHLPTKKAKPQTEKVMSRVPPEDQVVEVELELELKLELKLEAEITLIQNLFTLSHHLVKVGSEEEEPSEQEVVVKEAGRKAEDQRVAGGCQRQTTRRRRRRPIASWLSWKAKTSFWRRLSR